MYKRKNPAIKASKLREIADNLDFLARNTKEIIRILRTYRDYDSKYSSSRWIKFLIYAVSEMEFMQIDIFQYIKKISK